jgi:putative DNA primase/helicase
MANLAHIFGGSWSPPADPVLASPEQQLQDAMRDAGLEPPDTVYLDGKIHRFKSGTKGTPGAGDKSGWYIAFSDGIPAGRFGCWRAGMESTWRAEVGRQISPADEMAFARRMAEAKAARDIEQARKHEVAADVVDTIWSECIGASPDHPYLKRKGIAPHSARVTGDGRLVVPLYDQDGTLSSLQYIDADGGKLYHPGGQTGGKFWSLGSMAEPGTIYVAEGFATAATIRQATDRPVVVAYSASNLVPVTAVLRARHPTSDLVIVADNDKSGVGQRYAEQACAKHGARMVMPPAEGDANDYAQAGGDLLALLTQDTGTAVFDKLQVVFGDQLGSEYEAPDELVEGLMTIGSSVVVYGDSNSGKTFWALSVATAIATGTLCYGKKTDPGLVIYLACEAPASIRSRMQAIKKFHGCNLENLAMVPVPMNFYNGDQDAYDVIELVKAVEQMKGQPVRLIIGDTLARMSAGANENSGEDMGPVMARFDQVATATKAALMIIHHNGKDAAKGARGWSGIRAHIDTEIEVIEKDGTRMANVTKQRELPGKGETIYFKLAVIEMGMSKFGNQATTCVAIPDDEANTKQPNKKLSKHDENIRMVERAWWASGTEERRGLPYLSRDGLRDLLIKDGVAERTARNKMDASRPDALITQLLNAGTLESYGGGWVFVNEVQASVMLMQKNEPTQCP